MIVKTRDAHVNDAAAIATIHISSSRAAYARCLDARAMKQVFEPTPTVDGRARTWQAWIERDQAVTVVAEFDGAIAGFCSLHSIHGKVAMNRQCEIVAIYVHPEYWRRGIGRRLWQSAHSHAKARGWQETVLWVLEQNARARRFYETIGFHCDGERRVFLERIRGSSICELRYHRKVDMKTFSSASREDSNNSSH